MTSEHFSFDQIQHLRSRLERLTVKAGTAYLSVTEASVICIALQEMENKIKEKRDAKSA